MESLTVLLCFVSQLYALKCALDQKAGDYYGEGRKSTCQGDTCWLFYDPILDQYMQDCLIGIARETGCRRLIVENKVDSYLCYCNHSDNCNAEFPTFHPNNQTATWAAGSFPYTNMLPKTMTCRTGPIEVSVPMNTVSTIDWTNTTTGAGTVKAFGCYMNGDIKMPREGNITIWFEPEYYLKIRTSRLYSLEPMLWNQDPPAIIPGSLFAIQVYPTIQSLKKYCRGVKKGKTCKVGLMSLKICQLATIH
ncbi:unnamed protein product, partial [Mesorhabditis spiculigera]